MNLPTASTTVIHAAITDVILSIFKLTTGFGMMYYCLVNCDDGDPSSHGMSPSESFAPGL